VEQACAVSAPMALLPSLPTRDCAHEMFALFPTRDTIEEAGFVMVRRFCF
jgi:hypothetical protein